MSLRDMAEVPGKLLEERMIEIKTLEDTSLAQYSVVKDADTGEHYLHYRYIHVDVASGGQELVYHQLMPIESDDVLGMLFSEQPYHFPEAWTRPFLRNGPDDVYIWFDPSPVLQADDDERTAAKIREALLKFKQQGSFDPKEVEKLLKEIDDY